MAEQNFNQTLAKFNSLICQIELEVQKIQRFSSILQAQNRLVQVKKIGKRKLKQKTVLCMKESKNIKVLFQIQENLEDLLAKVIKCKELSEKLN